MHAFFEKVKKGGGVSVRRIFVNLTGDIAAGALLSQIAYWYTPSSKTGKSKLRNKHDGRYWLAKTREELCEEACITLAQYRRAIKILKDLELVETRVAIFAGITRVHYFLDVDHLAHLSVFHFDPEKQKDPSS